MPEEPETFNSRLGEIALTQSHIERDKKDSRDWEILEKNFPEKKLVHGIHFSEIDSISYTEGSTYPYIEFTRYDGTKGKMFFAIVDPYKEIFAKLKEKIAVYRQAYE